MSKISESHYIPATLPSHQAQEICLEPKTSTGYPWIAIFSSMPSIVALVVTILLFVGVYLSFDPEPHLSLYDFWISRMGFTYILLVYLLAACREQYSGIASNPRPTTNFLLAFRFSFLYRINHILCPVICTQVIVL